MSEIRQLTFKAHKNNVDPIFKTIYSKAKEYVEAGDLEVILREQKRTDPQNDLMWVILDKFAKQRKWPVNGEMVYMSNVEWKHVLTAAFKQECIRLAQGLNGGVVMLGASTREFRVKELSSFIEFLYATAVELGVDTNG